MNKTTAVIATILTTLVLLMAGGVLYSYRAQAREAGVQESLPGTLNGQTNVPDQRLEQPATAGPTTQELLATAISYLGRSDVYSLESRPENGALGYYVTFSSGEIVHLDASGQVLGVDRPQPTNISQRDKEEDEHEGYESHHEDEDEWED